MIGRTCLAVVALLALLSPALPGQAGEGEPPWVIYRRGVQALEDGNFGAALQRFRTALSQRRPFPEVEAGLGRVFEAEGNITLAIRQYERALELAESFYVSETEFEVRYRLAELHRNQEAWMQYQNVLQSITDRDPQFDPENDPPYRQLIPNVLTRSALEDRPPEPRLDTLLTLYRLEANFAYRAHLDLGEQFLDAGRFDPAVDHLSFAAVEALSTLVAELRRETYGYEFESTPALISDALELERLRRYMDEAEVFRAMYRLGGALWGLDNVSEVPAQIWRVVADFPDAAGEWSLRASRALENPEAGILVDY